MTKAELVKKFLENGQEYYKSQGRPEEHFLIDTILEYMRLANKEQNSLKSKRKAKREAKNAKSF